jgi:hypothetical protein
MHSQLTFTNPNDIVFDVDRLVVDYVFLFCRHNDYNVLVNDNSVLSNSPTNVGVFDVGMLAFIQF